MTDTKTDRIQKENIPARERLAANITLITFLLMVILSVVTLFFIAPEDKTPIDNFMMPLVAFSAGYGYYLSRNGKYLRGIYLLMATIAVVAILYAVVIDNVGWQAAIGMLVTITGITNGTLSERDARRITNGAFITAVGIVFLDLFLTGFTAFPVTTSSIIVTTVLGLIYVGLILYRFKEFPLQAKITITFIFLSIVSVGAATIAISTTTRSQLNQKVQQQLESTSQLTATTIAAELDKQIDLLRILTSHRSLVIRVITANNDAETDLNLLKQKDEKWRAVPAENTIDPLIRSVLENELASELRRFQEDFPEHIEVFLTDRYGANIAATNRTTDYYQADEEWWQAANNNGLGAVYISQPVFDESIGAISIQIAIPVYSAGNNEVIGILRTTLNMEVFSQAFQLGRFGETGRTEVYLPGNLELEGAMEADGEFELEIEESPADFAEQLQKETSFIDGLHAGEPVLASVSPLVREEDDPDDVSAISELGWRVVTLQGRAEALQIVEESTRNAQVVGLGVVLIAVLLAIGMTQFLATPILRLTQVAEEVAQGNLNATATTDSADEIGTLAEVFNRMTGQLRDSLTNLEKRVAERTADLEISRRQSEKRANQLLATGEISKIINSEQNLSTLLSLVSRLVSERFGFYHTGIFLIEETKQYAVLQSASSEGGRNMLRRGHKLRIGESGIVGFVAKYGEPRIALDVGRDAVYFDNPDLPGTRSEMALPLNFLDVTIGVLDVQSEKPGAFTDDDVNTLRILADQIAIAIQNTRLFEQTQQTLGEIQSLYRQNIQEGWKSFNREEGMVGYYQGLSGGKKLAETVNTNEIQQTLNRGETSIFHADGKTDQPSIVVPIKLRGQIIGVIHIKAPSRDRLWTSNEINLSEAVSERLSLALENARLLHESQRQAIIEQTISDITGKIGASINLENVLQTAVEELGRNIPGSEVIIRIKDDNSNGHGE